MKRFRDFFRSELKELKIESMEIRQLHVSFIRNLTSNTV